MTQLREWLLLEQVILSDQMPAEHLASLLSERPDFAEWLRSRARERRVEREANDYALIKAAGLEPSTPESAPCATHWTR